MNLLLVDSVDFPFGGAHSVHVSLVIKGLRENGENAFLIIPYGNKREDIASTKNKYGHFDGVPYYFVRRHDSREKIFQLFHVIIGVLKSAFLIVNRKKKNKVDAVILGGADVLRHFPILLLCSLYKVPLYGWRVEKGTLAEDIRGFSGFLNLQAQKLTERYLPRFCTGIIVISTFLKKHYLKYLPEKRILINPILVSNDTFKVVKTPDIELIKSKLGEKFKNKRILVYSGSYGEKDGVYYLIDAFKKVIEKFPDTIFVMTGKSRNNLVMNEVVQYVENTSMKEKILLVGFVNSEKLLSYTYAADILFVCRTNSPYANHGFPWKLGEYCMTGKPVIATRVGDIEVYFKDNEDLYIVEPNNSDAIAEKIAFIFKNYPKAVSVANKGKITATKCFGYLEKTQDIIDFIKDNSDPKVHQGAS
jgi:glycosyltransferase involved in cell wall biosynthesis